MPRAERAAGESRHPDRALVGYPFHRQESKQCLGSRPASSQGERPILGVVEGAGDFEVLIELDVSVQRHVVGEERGEKFIAPPLDGPGWLDGGGCCDMSAHRNALNPLSGGL